MSEKKTAEVIDLRELMSQEIGEAPIKTVFNGIPKDKEEDFLGLGPVETEEEKATKKAKEAAAEAKRLEEEKETEEEKATREAGEAAATKKLEEETAAKLLENETGEEKAIRIAKEEEEAAAAKGVIEPGSYNESIKNLFGDDITHIIQEDAEGNEVEVAIEDIEMTQEVYEDIVKAKLDEIRNEAKKDTVSTKGVSDFTKQMIEIDRTGGDVSKLMQAKESYTDVLDKLDLAEAADQKKAIVLRYKASGDTSDSDIEILIKGFEAQGVLAEKSETAEKEIREAVQKQVDLTLAQAKEKKSEEGKLLKEYEKEIVTNLDVFDLDPKLKTKIAKLTVKKDSTGRYEIDNLYYQLKNDPKKAAKLALFLLDEKEYDKQVSRTTKKAMQLKGAKKLTLVKRNSGTGDMKAGTKATKSDVINLKALNEE